MSCAACPPAATRGRPQAEHHPRTHPAGRYLSTVPSRPSQSRQPRGTVSRASALPQCPPPYRRRLECPATRRQTPRCGCAPGSARAPPVRSVCCLIGSARCAAVAALRRVARWLRRGALLLLVCLRRWRLPRLPAGALAHGSATVIQHALPGAQVCCQGRGVLPGARLCRRMSCISGELVGNPNRMSAEAIAKCSARCFFGCWMEKENIR